MTKSSDLIRILIPAVGGQGGGVLTEWLVQAFQMDGYEVQGIGLPGLSQRAGSTTYYIEAHPKLNDPKKRIIFSQYPVPGDVDIILSQEFLELGSVLEQGYGSSDKTSIITSTHRIYSTLEKLPVATGIYTDEKLNAIATEFSKTLIGFNVLELANSKGMDELAINAILLGALASSGALPTGEVCFIKAIESVGVAVANNIKSFRIGWDYVKEGKFEADPGAQNVHWEDFVKVRADKLNPNDREKYLNLFSESIRVYPIHLREILAEAIYRLIDYQGVWYAEKYLADLNDIFQIDKQYEAAYEITKQFAKNYALWMTYEDGIRVAELKIKPERFQRIREEMRVGNDQIFRVYDYLKPDFYEMYGLFPNILVKPFIKLANTKLFKSIWKKKTPFTFAQKPETSSPGGFLRLWFLTLFKFTRPWSYRFKNEHAHIEQYKLSVERYSKLNYELGCLVSKSASMVKGYGKVRRRTIQTFDRFLDNIISPLCEKEYGSDPYFTRTIETGEQALELIASSTEGIDQAEIIADGLLNGKAVAII